MEEAAGNLEVFFSFPPIPFLVHLPSLCESRAVLIRSGREEWGGCQETLKTCCCSKKNSEKEVGQRDTLLPLFFVQKIWECEEECFDGELGGGERRGGEGQKMPRERKRKKNIFQPPSSNPSS